MTTRTTGRALRLFYVEGECCASAEDSQLRAFIVAAGDVAAARALVDAECRALWASRLDTDAGPTDELGATHAREIGTASARLRRPRIVVHVGELAQ